MSAGAAEEILDKIRAGLGTWVAGNSFYGYLPDTPNQALCVYEYDGSPQFALGTDQAIYEEPRVQVRVRGVDYATARADIIAVRTLLQTVNGTLGSTKYMNVKASGQPIHLGPDVSNREEFTLNFEIMKETS